MYRFYFAAGALVLAVILTALVVAEPFTPDKPAREARLKLTGVERNGSILLDWNPNSPLIAAATSAALDIVDGGIPQRRPVDLSTLRLGGLAYRRRDANVQLKLILMKHSRILAQPSVRLTGDAPVMASE